MMNPLSNLGPARAACAAFLLSVSVTVSFAQGMMSSMMSGPRPTFGILMRPDVRTDLKLSSQQIAAIDAVLAPLIQDIDGRRGIRLGPNSDIGAINASAERPLTAAQRSRLKQINLWLEGGRSLGRAEVQRKLRMTEKQVETIQVLESEFRQEMMSKVTGRGRVTFRSTDDGKFGKRMLDVLTPAQKTAFNTLRGRPFVPAVRK